MAHHPTPAFPRFEAATPTYPLHAAAEGIYRGQQLDPEFSGYWTATACEITGKVDISLLRRSIEETIGEAEALHVRCSTQPHGYVNQEVRGQSTWKLSTVNLPDAENLWAAAEPSMNRLRETAPNLQAGPLFYSVLYVSNHAAIWYLQAHHLVCDGYGYSLLHSQMSRRYRKKMRRGDHFGSYADLIADDRAYQESAQRDADRDYWVNLLGESRATGLADGAALPSASSITHSVPLPSSEHSGSAIAWPHRLVAATAALVHCRTGSSRPVVGLPVANRSATTWRVPAMAMNIVPVPVTIPPAATVDDLAAQVAATMGRSRPHLRYRYEWLRRDLKLSPTHERLFAPTVNVIPYFDPPLLPGCQVQLLPISAGPVDDLSITARGSGQVTVEANPALYTQAQLADIATDLTRLWKDSAVPVSQWHPLPTSPAPPRRSLTERIDHQVARRPDALAVIDREASLTYRQLQQRAEEVAGYLLSQRVTAGDIIALEMPRGSDALVAMLGVHYAGAAYLPLDPEASASRRQAIIEVTEPALTLSAPLPSHAPSRAPIDADQPAYVIFTSGSTGRPKGVTISHAARDFFIAAALTRYNVSDTDRVLQFAPLHFDAHVEEVFVTWAAGATLVVRDDSANESLPAFADFLGQAGVTVLDLPTAYWHEMVRALHHSEIDLPSAIHTVIIGGEAVNPHRVQQWHERLTDQVQLLNTYGPTEATVVCLSAELRPGGPINLGRPWPGVEAAIGPGDELFVSGPGLASGYLGTDQEFATEMGQKLWYATGDVVSLNLEGDLEYVGRRDREIKISGQRIDPMEVEAALLTFPTVTHAAVTTDRVGTTARLLAFISGDADTDTLFTHLSEQLPQAALPSRITRVDTIPVTSSGKVDYQALNAPDDGSAALPRTPTETIIAEVYAEVLGTAVPTLTTDFFHCGGSSLKAVAAASRLSSALDRGIAASQIFAAPTIAGLADSLEGREDGAVPQEAALADAKWNPPAVAPPSGEHIALTGATGFVGSWLAARLLHTTDRDLFCVTRSDHTRLRQALLAAGAAESDLSRVHSLPLDLAGGVIDQPTKAILKDCGQLIHSAAEVSLGRPYASLRQVNTQAVGQLLRAAADTGTEFHHISTVAVGANSELAEDFIGFHDGLQDGYQLSKWVAEDLLRQAGQAGLPVSCYRLGRVVPPEGTDVSNAHDLVSYLVSVGLTMGTLPHLPVWEPWVEVDVAARNIAALATGEARGVWNLIVDEPVNLATYLSAIAAENGCQIQSMEQWSEQLGKETSSDAQALQAFFATRSAAPPETGPPVIDHARFANWLISEPSP